MLYLRHLNSDVLQTLVWILLCYCVQEVTCGAHGMKGQSLQTSGRKSQSSQQTVLLEPGPAVVKVGIDSQVRPHLPLISEGRTVPVYRPLLIGHMRMICLLNKNDVTDRRVADGPRVGAIFAKLSRNPQPV